MIRPPVSAEARGRVRELAASLQISAARMGAALARVPAKTLAPWTWKGRVGTQRALAKILLALPAEPELRIPTKCVWRYLKPVDDLPARGAEQALQPGFVCMGIIAGDRNRQVRAETFGFAATAHSVARLLDRSGFRIDPVKAMLEAHAALTFLDFVDGSKVFDLENAQLPAAGGAFLVSPGRFGPDAAPLAIARTWVSNDQLHADQDQIAAAWRQVIAQGGGVA